MSEGRLQRTREVYPTDDRCGICLVGHGPMCGFCKELAEAIFRWVKVNVNRMYDHDFTPRPTT